MQAEGTAYAVAGAVRASDALLAVFSCLRHFVLTDLQSQGARLLDSLPDLRRSVLVLDRKDAHVSFIPAADSSRP